MQSNLLVPLPEDIMSTLALLATLIAAPALAGENTTHEVELQAGVAWLHKADRLASPLPSTGIAPAVSLGWSARGRRSVNELGLGLSLMSARFGPSYDYGAAADGAERTTGPSAFTMVDIQYSHGRRIEAEGWTLHVGGTSANRLEDLSYAYGFTGATQYFGTLELGPWTDLRIDLGDKHGLELEAWIPLLAWVARNPYAIHDEAYMWNNRDKKAIAVVFRYIGDGSMHTWNHYQAGHARVGYHYDLGKTWTLFAQSRVDFLHFSEPQPVVQWQLGLNLGIRGRF